MKIRNKHIARRTLSAILLLMVMVLQVGVKTFHQHHHAVMERVVCCDCEHHRVHSGHILNWEDSGSDCLLCQLFAVPYCKAQDVVLSIVPTKLFKHSICHIVVVPQRMQMHIISRAPPAFLL